MPVDLGVAEGLKATEAVVVGDGVTYIQYRGEATPVIEEGK